MKHFSFFSFLFSLFFVACNKEELPGTPDATRSPMSISVIDGGYASGDKSHTRATENGYITEFTAGDQIGFYIVKSDDTYAEQNVCLTLTDVGGILKWQAPVGTTLYYEGATAKYFAYYPYQQTVSGALEPSASTAVDFFADVINKCTPAADQSTYTKYTASDLMTGVGTLGSKQADGTVSLSFAMAHAMALMVIETPITKYSLSTNNNYTWIAEAPDTKFYDFAPCRIDGVYRHLVKPAQSGAADLMGSYTDANSKTKEYALAQNGIATANYAYYKVDGGSATIVTTKTHILQVCDFFMKDGSLVDKNASLTEAQKAACTGIVYQKSADGKGGMVVEKNEVEYIKWSTEYMITGATSITDGADNMTAIKKIDNWETKYPAFKLCADKGEEWYLPAKNELSALCAVCDADGNAFNEQLAKCAGIEIVPGSYWSSSEESRTHCWYVDFFYNGRTDDTVKTRGSCVRCVRAF